MRRRIIYILKHNETVQRIYKTTMSFIFGVITRMVRCDKNLILFVSFMGSGFNDSPKAIYDYIQSHEEYRNYRCLWAFEHPEKFTELDTVKIDTPSFMFMN